MQNERAMILATQRAQKKGKQTLLITYSSDVLHRVRTGFEWSYRGSAAARARGCAEQDGRGVGLNGVKGKQACHCESHPLEYALDCVTFSLENDLAAFCLMALLGLDCPTMPD